jgi:hypothetical protein
MGVPRTLGVATVVTGTPIPAVLAAAGYTGVVIAAASFSIKNKIATIVLGSALPATGYNGPNNSIQGNFPAPNGNQVTLWGFATATYFNGKKISVISNDPVAKSFSFYFNHADVTSTSDTGNTAPSPFQHYRAIRIECSQSLGADFIYVGDLNVSSTRYVAALSLLGQLSVEIASENIPPEAVFIDGTTDGDSCQISLIY